MGSSTLASYTAIGGVMKHFYFGIAITLCLWQVTSCAILPIEYADNPRITNRKLDLRNRFDSDSVDWTNQLKMLAMMKKLQKMKRNFDELDNSGFGKFYKRNFDQVDGAGFGTLDRYF